MYLQFLINFRQLSFVSSASFNLAWISSARWKRSRELDVSADFDSDAALRPSTSASNHLILRLRDVMGSMEAGRGGGGEVGGEVTWEV